MKHLITTLLLALPAVATADAIPSNVIDDMTYTTPDSTCKTILESDTTFAEMGFTLTTVSADFRLVVWTGELGGYSVNMVMLEDGEYTCNVAAYAVELP